MMEICIVEIFIAADIFDRWFGVKVKQHIRYAIDCINDSNLCTYQQRHLLNTIRVFPTHSLIIILNDWMENYSFAHIRAKERKKNCQHRIKVGIRLTTMNLDTVHNQTLLVFDFDDFSLWYRPSSPHGSRFLTDSRRAFLCANDRNNASLMCLLQLNIIRPHHITQTEAKVVRCRFECMWKL